jgi:hypothetical protein
VGDANCIPTGIFVCVSQCGIRRGGRGEMNERGDQDKA